MKYKQEPHFKIFLKVIKSTPWKEVDMKGKDRKRGVNHG